MDPTELWRQWYDAGLRMWSSLSGDDRETYVDPFGVYRQWFENLQDTRKEMEEGPAGITDLHETWRRWAEAVTETWRRAAEIGTSMMGLAVPRWMEMAQEVQKQMLNGGNFPTDPLDFYTRLYNATSGPLSKMADDILKDESFLEYSRRFFDYYAVSNSIFRRASEEYFSNLQLPTSSDTTQMAGLIVALDDKVDRVEGVLEEFEDGYEELAGAVDDLKERLDRVEGRLDQLDRLENKLDQLLAAQDATTGGQ